MARAEALGRGPCLRTTLCRPGPFTASNGFGTSMLLTNAFAFGREENGPLHLAPPQVTEAVVSHVAARNSRRRMNTPRNTASSSSRVAISLRRTRSQPAANIIIQACTWDRLRHLKLPGMLVASAAGSLQMTASDTRAGRNKKNIRFACDGARPEYTSSNVLYSGTDYRPIQDRLQHVRTLANPYPARHHRNLLSV